MFFELSNREARNKKLCFDASSPNRCVYEPFTSLYVIHTDEIMYAEIQNSERYKVRSGKIARFTAMIPCLPVFRPEKIKFNTKMYTIRQQEHIASLRHF